MSQKNLIELFAIMLNNTNSQLVLSTHSPYILSVANNLLFATRVVDKNPASTEDVESVIQRISWLNPNEVNVYFLRNGQCESVFNEMRGLIDQNMLDEISEELGADFDELYHILSRAFK